MTVAETIAGWARELSDVGGPNTLLWAPPRRDCLLDLTTAHPGGVSMLLAGRQTRLTDLVREPAAFDDALVVARRIHDQGKSLLEQRGLACGFVVIGVATWDPPRAGAVIEAPVLLRTCSLRPTPHGDPDYVLDLGGTVEVNPALVNYLRSVSGIEVDPVALAGLAEGSFGFDPYPVYAALGRLCTDVPGFAVSPRIVVGTYPYAKLDMVADISANARWLAQVDLVAALGGDANARDRLPAATPPVVTEPDPDREVAPIDVDPAQGAVIDAIRAGGSLVLDAPRGTGGTQAVAALVAAAAYDGKSVLYVTTRHQSVRDLRDRLADAQLPDLVLDLVGADAQGSAAVNAVVASIDATTADRPSEHDDLHARAARAGALTAARKALIDHVDALHERREPWGVTAYDVQEEMARLAAQSPPPGSRVRISGPTLRGLSRDRIAELALRLQAAAAAGAWDTGSPTSLASETTSRPEPGEPNDPDGHNGPGGHSEPDDRIDPWYGADIRTEADAQRAREILGRLAGEGLTTRAAELDGILAESSLPPARTPAEWERALRTMRGVRDTLEVFRPEIFDRPLDEHVAATGSSHFRGADDEVDLGWVTRSRVRRQTRRLLRPGKPPADLHAELLSAREQRNDWFDLVGAGGRPEISPRLDDAQERYDALAVDLHWLSERLATTEAGGGLHELTMPLLRGRLKHLASRPERLSILPQVTPVLAELRAAGMTEVLDDFARRSVTADQVPTELDHIWWGSIGQEITLADSRYAGHDGPALRRAAVTFREQDTAHRDDSRALVRAQHLRVARRRIAEHQRQVDLLRAQLGAGRGRLRFADLFRETESVLTGIYPCIAMSPYAVAHLLTPGTSFDVVVVDDAAAVTVAETVSALSRARQVVIVGSATGGMPSRFLVGVPQEQAGVPHTRARSGDTSVRVSLFHAARHVLPVRSLRWWHSPADPRLHLDGIPDALGGIPSPDMSPPITFELVEGVAHVAPSGDDAVEWTQAEVDRVIALVAAHLASSPRRSLAIVALTAGMADQIRAGLPTVGGAADIPVALVTDAAGVTADELIVAVGYGRTPRGRVVYRFPSLADDAVLPQIQAAVGSAQQNVVVVSTLRAADLDPARLRSAGPRWLRSLLEAAERWGAMPESGPTSEGGGEGDAEPGAAASRSASAVLDYLRERLVAEGLIVAASWGVGPHRVELAVGHPDAPGRYLVAVTSDGPEYAALPGIRSRERLRPEQAERCGWRWVSVWSTDVYRDPAREVARIVAGVRAAMSELEATQAQGNEHMGDDAGSRAETQASGELNPAVVPSHDAKGSLDQSRDDTDAGWGERSDESAHDRWLQEQRPPHWE
jgi:hypothetical protein